MKNKRAKQKKFMAMYDPVHDRFERFCVARAYGDMAPEDLMHDTVVIAYEKLDTIENASVFLHFLCGTAIRVLANANRKLRPIRHIDEGKVSETVDHQADLSRKDDIEALYHGLSKLPAEQRDALTLFELSGFTIAEIAVIQEAGISAVKQRLARGRKALLEILSKELSQESKMIGL